MSDAPVPAALQVKFSVPYAYDIHFTRGVFEPKNATFLSAVAQREPQRRHRLLFVVDAGVARAWPNLEAAVERYVEAHCRQLELVSPLVVVEGGEVIKNDAEVVNRLYREVAARHVDRQSFLVVIGGGAVQDMAGFVAATAHRGVRLIRVPTTVLSQNDSGVGVKNGVNFRGLKNFTGSFAVPHAVVNDLDFLTTLDVRDRRAGLAEALKVSLVKDKAYFLWLESNASSLAQFEAVATQTMIARCAQLHTEHIAGGGDPFERGSARPLDFGHWAAHKLETLTDHRLRHGEAVAIGIALDIRYSVESGLLNEAQADRAVNWLRAIGFELWVDELAIRGGNGRLQLLDGLSEFREHLGGELTITLLQEIGHGVEVHQIDEPLMERGVAWLSERFSSKVQL